MIVREGPVSGWTSDCEPAYPRSSTDAHFACARLVKEAVFLVMPDEPLDKNGPTFGTVSRIIDILEPLSAGDREHVMRTVATWFRMAFGDVSVSQPAPQPSPAEVTAEDEKFSERTVLSPKEFILEKDPITEVERLACLAFYLTHYLNMPHFKNVDLSRLNTEAAQRKLSNPAVAISNAMRDGFFVQASEDGYKQLSAMGERFVQLLPDREAAKKIKERMSSRRSKKGSGRGDAANSEAENRGT